MQPIVLALYGPDGELSVSLSPVRALELAKDLTEPPANNGQPLLRLG